MQYLNTFLGLLAKTSSRDQILRLVQYATLHSEDHNPKGSTYNIYVQMRRTRKILRFLRTIQYSTLIRKDITGLPALKGQPVTLALKIITILQNLFTFLFFIFDHRVFLGELEVISKQSVAVFYPRSLKMYFLQNVFGALRSIMQAAVIILQGKYKDELVDMDNGAKLIRDRAIQFLRHILDIFVALYYLRKPAGGAARTGVIGVITSIIAICESLKLI